MNYIFRLSYDKIFGIGPRYNVPSTLACLSRAPRSFLHPSRRLGSCQICEFVV